MRRTPEALALSAVDADEPDVAGAPNVRAAAQLDRPGLVGLALAVRPGRSRAFRLAHGDDAHLIAVFLAEQRPRARLARILQRHQPGLDGRVPQHVGIRHGLHGRELVGRHGLGVREVEAQPIRRHQRAPLLHVIAEHLAQGLVQEMGGGVVGARGRAPRMIDDELDPVAGLEGALLDAADVHEDVAQSLLRIGDAEQRALGALDEALVADLAARTRRRTASGSAPASPPRRP